MLLKQMLMLAAMMISGYVAFKIKLFDKTGQHQISNLIVYLLNPCILLSSLSGDKPGNGLVLSFQNLIISLLYYVFCIAISYVFYFIFRKSRAKNLKLKQFMVIFANLGFFGIPIIRALFGPEYVIYLIFYMLLFNLFAYTLGFALVRSGNSEEKFSFKSLINTGTVGSVVALILYFSNVPIPETAASFLSYMGNVCIPVSMILIGGSLAQLDLKSVFTDKDIYFFILIRNIIIPAIGILIFRQLPFDPTIVRICCLVISMPIATLTGMIAEHYAHEGNYCNKMIAMSTVLSVVTVPLLSLLYL